MCLRLYYPRLGDSIAVNGTCLTVTTFDSSSFVVGLAPETLRRTNLGDLKEGSPVNLERSLRADSRLGGHFVQGHVDGTGVITNKRPEGDSLWLTVQCDPSLLKYIVPKGYIAVDGTSLTVVEVNDEESWFTFMLVAYTQQKIVVPGKQIGDRVNLEVDIVGKYVERVIAPAYNIRTCIHLLRPACPRFVSPVPPTLPPPLTVPLPFPIAPAAPALSQTVLEALARNDQFHAHVSALAAGGAAPEPPDGAGPSTSGRTSAYLRRLLGLAGAPRSTSVSANNSSAESSPRALFHDFDGRSGPPSAQSLAAAAGAGSRGGAGAGAGVGGVPVLGGVMGRSRKERSVSPIPAASRLSTSADASRAKARQHDPKALAHAALAAVTTGSAGGAGGNSTARHGGRERGDALRAQSANEHLRLNSHGGNRSRVVPVNASLNTSDSPDAHNGSACAAEIVGGRSGGGAQAAEGLGGECRPRAAGGTTAGGTTTAETMDGGGDGARPIALGNGLGAESGAGTGEAAGAAVGFSAAGRSAGGNSAAQESANFPPEEAAAGGMGAAAVPAGTARKSSSVASTISGGNSARVRRSHDKKGISATSSGASTSNPSLRGGESRSRAAKGHGHPTQQLMQSAQAAQPGGLEEVGTGGRKNGGAGAADGAVGGGIWQLVREDGQEHSPVSTLDFSQAARPAGETEAEGREGNWVPTIPPVSASLSSVRPSKAVVLPGDVMPRVLSPPPHALADDPASSGAAHINHSTGVGGSTGSTDQTGHRASGMGSGVTMGASAGACMQSGVPMHANGMMGGMGGMGGIGGMDAEGMEQDLDYVRHILIAAGFAGPRLPPLDSQDRPIPPHIFPHLESSIVAAASPRPLLSSAFPPGSTQAEERRQRRLLFDAVNEALGRRLGPYVELPVWAEGLREPLVRPRPVGLALLQEVWGEIHDWPVAASEEVYDILDDAARRDMGRGVDRWVDVIEEMVGVVREVEEAVTMQLIGEVVGEMTDVERQRKARRRNTTAAGGGSSAGGGSAPATPTRRLLRSSSGGGLSVQELVGGKNGNPLKGFRWLGRRGL
ncbi:unnamed protein product [Closterium sp. Naga37s-1]|nr:unnamed protein product [Closterium sp. Naga37s-1]